MPSISTVFIVPARMGSKRIPRKNLVEFHGRPIIEWVVEILAGSDPLALIVITTDSPDDFGFLRRKFSNVEILARDAVLADDYTTSVDVVRDSIRRLGIDDECLVMMAYPTSIFLNSEIIERVSGLACKLESNFIATVTSVDRDRELSFLDSGYVLFDSSAQANTRTQDMPSYFRDAAQLYAARAKVWINSQPFVSPTMPVVLDSNSVVDIDKPRDLLIANIVFQHPECACHR